MLKIFQFQEDTEASLFEDLKRIIAYVKFVFPISCTVFFFLNEKTLLVLIILPNCFYIESTNDKVLIFQQQGRNLSMVVLTWVQYAK